MRVRVTTATRVQITTYCVTQGLTEEELAARCNLSGMTVRRLLSRTDPQKTARIRTAAALARELGLATPDLFGTVR